MLIIKICLLIIPKREPTTIAMFIIPPIKDKKELKS